MEIVQLLIRKRVAIPSYNVLATLIANAINHYQDELNQIIEENIKIKNAECINCNECVLVCPKKGALEVKIMKNISDPLRIGNKSI